VPDRENAGVSSFLRGYLRHGMVVVDVGANVGELTAVAAECVGPSGRVIAFEPSPANVERLRERFAALPYVEVRHAAVSDRAGSLTFHLDADNAKRHSLYASIVSVPGSSIVVPSVRLDDLDEHRRVDFIKIDAQGAEGRILAGARTLIERDHPVLLFELWPSGMLAAGTPPAGVLALLDALGYRCVRLSVKGRQKSRPSIDRFLAEASRWASTNVIAWPPPPRLSAWHSVRHRLRRGIGVGGHFLRTVIRGRA
jgi:FkbM family methyltransferase